MNKSLGWFALASLLVACSSTQGATGSPDAGARSDAQTPDATGDSSASGKACTKDGDCASFLAGLTPTPAGCAEAYCDTILSRCAVRPVDDDMDTYRTASCSVPGMTFTPGTDCNDHDPNLYPGHPETCTVFTDGGLVELFPGGDAGAGVCMQGQVSCLMDGTESACLGTVVCENKACVAGKCVSGCDIQGTQYSAAQVDPTNACQSCQPGQSTTAWTIAADGASCGNGQICEAGVCGSECDIGGGDGETGQSYTSGVANPANACQSCQPGMSTTAWSNLAPGSPCGAGEVCFGSACTPGCFIDGNVTQPGTTGAPICQSCVPGTSTTAWTNQAPGSPCGTGEICNDGSCAAGCFIGGASYAVGTVNPGNPCQDCEPGTSVMAWTNLVATTCGTGGTCSAGACVFAASTSAQSIVVPSGVTQLTVTAFGAAGGACNVMTPGGAGGEVVATIPVTPGDTLGIYVGGAGACEDAATATTSFNGGGSAGAADGSGSTVVPTATGGGASDVRQGGTALTNRVVVAGGGGGGGQYLSGYTLSLAGAGGGMTGGTATTGAAGGTSSGGGLGGTGVRTGGNGSSGLGGGGASYPGADTNVVGGAGGGGGYYGGGGAAAALPGEAGGGGSGYAEAPATGVTMSSGVRTGDGQVTVAF